MNGKDLFRGLSYISRKYIDEAENDTISGGEGAYEGPKAGKRLFHKSLLIAAVIATMLFLMGAAVYTHWSSSMQRYYQPTEKAKQQAEKTGLSVMYEESQPEDGGILSATDQGITVSLVQTIAAEGEAKIILRVEGFKPPVDYTVEPWVWVDEIPATLDGDEEFWVSTHAAFDDGILEMEQTYADGTPLDTKKMVRPKNSNPPTEGEISITYDDTIQEREDGQFVYPDGTPVEVYWESYPMGHYFKQDGSMELVIDYLFQGSAKESLGKELQLHLTGFGTATSVGPANVQFEKLVEGNWDLCFPLTGSSEVFKATPNIRVSDIATLTDVEIGEIDMTLRYKTDTYWDGSETMEDWNPQVAGVRLKDGSMVEFWTHTHGHEAGFEGQTDRENLNYIVKARATQGIVELDQIQGLVYYDHWERNEEGRNVPIYKDVPLQ